MGIACAVMSQPSMQGINGAYADSTSVESQSVQSSSDTFDTELSVTRLREFPTSLRQIPRDESIQQSRAIDSSLERRGSIAGSLARDLGGPRANRSRWHRKKIEPASRVEPGTRRAVDRGELDRPRAGFHGVGHRCRNLDIYLRCAMIKLIGWAIGVLLWRRCSREWLVVNDRVSRVQSLSKKY
jgi:hypothetical protein